MADYFQFLVAKEYAPPPVQGLRKDHGICRIVYLYVILGIDSMTKLALDNYYEAIPSRLKVPISRTE